MLRQRTSSLALLAGCLCLLAMPAPGQKVRTNTSRAIVTITDAPSTTPGVLSDGKGIYTDHKLEDGDPCVNAFVGNDGFFNIQMDFSTNVGAGCNATLGTVGAGTARWYALQFPHGHAACTQFVLASNGSVCTLTLDPAMDEPIVGIPKLFNGAAESQVRFRFKRGGTYWVVALSGVPMDATQNPQTVSYVGPAKLFNETKGKTGGQLGGDFSFSLNIEIQRVPAP